MVNRKSSTKNTKPTEEIVEEIKFQGKSNRVYLDKNNIIHWEVLWQPEDPLQINRESQEVLDAIFKLAKKSSRKARVFMDFRKVIIAGTSKSRRLLGDALKTGVFERVAVLGMSVFVRIAAKFVVAYAGVKFVKFFNSKKEALKWLKR